MTVYYRLYTSDGPISTRKPIVANDRFLGRITATSVPPPHTVASLMRCISRAELINPSVPSNLYNDLSDISPVDDGPVSILQADGIGSTRQNAVAILYSPVTPLMANRAPEPEPTQPSFNMKIKAKQDCGMPYYGYTLLKPRNLSMFWQLMPRKIPNF